MVLKRWITEWLSKHKVIVQHYLNISRICFLPLLPFVLLYAYGFGTIFLQMAIALWLIVFIYDLMEYKKRGLINKVYANIKNKFTPYQRGWIRHVIESIIVFIVVFVFCALLF